MAATSALLAIVTFIALCAWIYTARKDQPSTDKLILLVITVGALLRIVYAIETPTFYAPDEEAHFNYIQYLVEHHQLPVQTSMTGDASNDWEYYQPPFYYIVMTPVYLLGNWLFEETHTVVSTIRLASILFWLANIFLLLSIIRNLKIEDEFIKLTIITVAALLPTYTFISSMINNDSLLATLATGMIYWLTRYRNTISWALIAGVIIGIAMWTKLSAVIIASAFSIFTLIRIWRDRNNWQGYLLQGITAGVVAALIWSPIAIRNFMIYDSITALHVANVPYHWDSLTQAIEHNLANISKTFWATSGIYNNVHGNFAKFGILLALIATASIIYQLNKRKLKIEFNPIIIAAILAAMINWILTLRFGFSYHQAQGRFLIPSLFAISLLLSHGWKAIPLSRPNTHIVFLFICYSVGFAAYSFKKFNGYLQPT